MRMLAMPAIALMLGGCATAGPARSGATAPWPGGESLLAHRATLCAADDTERQRLMTSYDDTHDHRQQFERLLLMSCDPFQHRDSLGEALQVASLNPDWSEDQRAFLAIMESHHHALERLEAERQVLERQLEDTIRGISEIEEDIDGRADKSPFEQESEP
jgi:hypothetical protein